MDDSPRSPVPLTPLERGYLRVLQLGALLPVGVLAIVVGVAWFILWPQLVERGAPPLLAWLLVPVALVAAWALLVAPGRRYRAWGYALAGDELHVARGIWTWVHTIVPLARVQHIDIAQGPVERACGVATLVVHTAGTSDATVALPGITRATAERLRDTIREHVRAEPW